MKLSKQNLASILALSIFIFFAFGSEDTETNDGNTSIDEVSKINNDANLSQHQKDSLIVIQQKADLEARKSQTISAKDLVLAYEENEVSADTRFKGKTFFVEGKIEDIGKDILDDIYITLAAPGSLFGTVQCYINDANSVAQLRKGQHVTVKGKCEGLLGNVGMNDCVLVETN